MPLLPRGDTGEVGSLHPEEEGHTSSLQNCKAINSVVYKPPGLWSFVTGAWLRHLPPPFSTQTLFISSGALITLCNHMCARLASLPHSPVSSVSFPAPPSTELALDVHLTENNKRGEGTGMGLSGPGRGTMVFSCAQVHSEETRLWGLGGGVSQSALQHLTLGGCQGGSSPQFPHL